MPRTDIKPLAEINIQKPGKITMIERPMELKKIPEKELKFYKLKLKK